MTSKPASAGPFSLRRWSQRKLEAARAEAQALPVAAASPSLPQQAPQATVARADPVPPAETPLPPIESLTIESDFTPFFRHQVDESVKRAALKQLLRDPRFNIMDGLDTYIDDYSQPDPIPAAMLEGLMQRRVSFALPEADEAAAPIAGETEGDTAARGAAAIAPPGTRIEPVPAMPTGLDPDNARDTAHVPPEGLASPQPVKP